MVRDFTLLAVTFARWSDPVRVLTRQRAFALSGIDQESNTKL